MAMGVLLALENASAQSRGEAPAEATVLDKQFGDATFYASYFDGRVTASGRLFDREKRWPRTEVTLLVRLSV